MDDLLTVVLALGLAALIVTAYGKKPAKTITGWLTVVLPAKKKGRKKK